MVDLMIEEYANELYNSLVSINKKEVVAATEVLRKAYLTNRNVFVCGNGGSAAISEHFLCDHSKGVCFDTNMTPKVHSLTGNISLITAIANDFSYEDIFSYQLKMKAIPGDVLVVISSSGNSPNVIKALEQAKELKMTTIALTGFTGGEANKMADIKLHIPATNYGIVEDAHQSLMHIISQYIRVAHLNKDIDNIKL